MVSSSLPVVAADACWLASRLTAEQAVDPAKLFRALSDPVRLRLLYLIASHDRGEAWVCDLADAFDLSQPAIFYDLKVLRESGLTTGAGRGCTTPGPRRGPGLAVGGPGSGARRTRSGPRLGRGRCGALSTPTSAHAGGLNRSSQHCVSSDE